jgi:hypothetical protein
VRHQRQVALLVSDVVAQEGISREVSKALRIGSSRADEARQHGNLVFLEMDFATGTVGEVHGRRTAEAAGETGQPGRSVPDADQGLCLRIRQGLDQDASLSNVRVLHLSIGVPTGRMVFFRWESNRAFAGLASGAKGWSVKFGGIAA